MGLKRVSKLIEKINVLHDSLLSIDEEISSIEKDLLLNYIRQLYEQVLEIGTEDHVLRVPSISRKVMDLPKEEKKKKKKKKEVKVAQEVDVEKDVKNSTEIETPIVSNGNGSQEIAEVPVIEKIEVEKEEVEKEEMEQVPAHEPILMDEINAELAEMFEMKEVKELSEKLSASPIKDLTKAVGINDRFLIVNELFGGNAVAYKECIDNLNAMEQYEDAKSYLLSEITQRYDWSSQEKLKKAAGFITLVQRRFR